MAFADRGRSVVEYAAMDRPDPSAYGQKAAHVYDRLVADLGVDDPATVPTLAEYSNGGRVLELGVGTGRVAIPLAGRGIDVWGIDVSDAMVAKLKEKPGGDRVTCVLGDFGDVGVDGEFALVYVVFNTFFALTSQQEQIECFANVAAHLPPGGFFLIEAFVPDVTRFDGAQRVQVQSLGADRARLGLSIHDSVNQRIHGQQIEMSEAGIEMIPIEMRYAWPSELDLMARLTGLTLRDRWAGWRREPFTVSSTAHVSLYEKPR